MNPESGPRFEKESRAGKLHRFFEIDSETEKRLKKSIEQSKGLIRIFIHPNFEEYAAHEDKPEQIRQLEQVKKIFDKIVSSSSGHTPPLFIFESGWKADEFLEKEAVLADIAERDIYVIRTEGASPNPLPPDFEEKGRAFGEYFELSPERREARKEQREEMWKWIVEEFLKWKIKKILIGGAELYVSEDENIGHSGCVGAAIEKLKPYFEIEISRITWPEKTIRKHP